MQRRGKPCLVQCGTCRQLARRCLTACLDTPARLDAGQLAPCECCCCSQCRGAPAHPLRAFPHACPLHGASARGKARGRLDLPPLPNRAATPTPAHGCAHAGLPRAFLPLQPGDLLRMEAIVLDCLSFRVNAPTAHTFLSMYKQALGLQPRTCALASYLVVRPAAQPRPARLNHPRSRLATLLLHLVSVVRAAAMQHGSESGRWSCYPAPASHLACCVDASRPRTHVFAAALGWARGRAAGVHAVPPPAPAPTLKPIS